LRARNFQLLFISPLALNSQPSTLNFLKAKSSSAWSAAKSEEHYGFKRWGSGHISVDN